MSNLSTIHKKGIQVPSVLCMLFFFSTPTGIQVPSVLFMTCKQLNIKSLQYKQSVRSKKDSFDAYLYVVTLTLALGCG